MNAVVVGSFEFVGNGDSVFDDGSVVTAPWDVVVVLRGAFGLDADDESHGGEQWLHDRDAAD